MSQPHRSPSEIDPQRSWFDELAAHTQEVVSRDTFFVALVALTLIWVPSYFLFDSLEHWYLAFVIPAEVATLFMVALLANHDRRTDQALHRKIDAIAAALAAITEDSANEKIRHQQTDLRATHGLEERESTDN